MNVILYGKPNCGGCVATKRALEKQGTPFEYVDIEQSGLGRAAVEDLGYSSLPVVFVSRSVHWPGFRPDRIKELPAYLEANNA